MGFLVERTRLHSHQQLNLQFYGWSLYLSSGVIAVVENNRLVMVSLKMASTCMIVG